jgi:hypothetical protein
MILVTDNYIYINLDQIVKPYYLGLLEFFKYVLWHDIKPIIGNRQVHIRALRGAPINIPPYSNAVDIIVQQLEMPSSNIFLHTRIPNFDHAGVTIVPYRNFDDEFLNKLSPFLKNLDPILLESDAKRFGALYGRITLGRILLAYYLESAHADKSIVTFLSDKDQFDDQIAGINDFFSDIRKWWVDRVNPVLAQSPDNNIGEFSWPKNITTYPEIACKFQIEIVVETDYYSKADYTEKTWRCLAAAKPFILLNGPGSMAELRNLGFKTYSPIIDESYDSLSNVYERIDAIKKEINRLSNMNDLEWNQTLQLLNQIAEENKRFYRSWLLNAEFF